MNDDRDPEIDASLAALFRSAEPPRPSADFASRTMAAIGQQPLPAGRHALGRRGVPVRRWIPAAAAAAAAVYWFVDFPAVARASVALLTSMLSVALSLGDLIRAALPLADIVASAGLALANALVTKEGSAAVIAMTAVAALSLTALRRLLNLEQESSVWQKLS
jgi:hypothetical protein